MLEQKRSVTEPSGKRTSPYPFAWGEAVTAAAKTTVATVVNFMVDTRVRHQLSGSQLISVSFPLLPCLIIGIDESEYCRFS